MAIFPAAARHSSRPVQRSQAVAGMAGSSDGGRGRLIVFEGGDGAGKTTQARLLAGRLDAVATFQMGATAVGAEIRRLVLAPPGDSIDLRAEALLVAADKAQHVAEVVEPALAAGRHVVSDRFTASSVVYQSYGRGVPRDELEQLLGFAVAPLEPDLTILLDIDPVVAARRRGGDSDRFEAAGEVFAGRVRRGYLELAAAGRRWVTLDAAPSTEEVAAEVAAVVASRLGIAAAAA